MKQLLIIEDNEAHRELIENSLRQSPSGTFGWDFAGSLKEGEDFLDAHRPDLILLDLSLPDSPPTETLPRAIKIAEEIPIIVLTSLDDRRTIMGMIQQGAKDCVPKAMMHGLFLERSIHYCLDRENILKEQKKLERAASFHKLFEKSRIGFVISTQEGFIVESNPAFATWLGYSREALAGKAIKDITVSAYWDGSRQALANIVSGKSEEEILEKRYLHKNGSEVWGSVILQKLYWLGHGDCILVSIHDMTSYKEAEKKVEAALVREKEANKAKTALLSMLGHDIRSPISNIISLTELLKDVSLEEEDLNCIRTVSDSARKLLGLIDDILEFSRVGSGQIQIRKEEVNVAEIIDSLCNSFQPSAESKGIQLDCQVKLENKFQLVDGNRIEQIMTNFLSNAVKFTEQGGSVHLRVSKAENSLRFSVEDDGIGIDENDIPKLFKPFSQANDSIHSKYSGTGLGLSICKQLADLMEGRVELTSVLGEGSTFTLFVPVETSQLSIP